MKEKVLFLDVDGVLNSWKTGGRYALKKGCLRRLERIIKDTGCKIVLSSTWRRDEYALKRLKRVLKYRGLEIYSTTPYIPSGPRGLEIQAWLISYPNPDGYRFAIVDDDSDMFDHQLPHFFQTDGEYGMTDAIAYRITFHLERQDE